MSNVIILGAKGRFGRAATHAFDKAGWTVTLVARGDLPKLSTTTRGVSLDVRDQTALAQACKGQDVIVNAINPPYHHWAREMPLITRSVTAAAQSSGATLLVPGNVYNYGADAPEVLTEETPWRPTTRKGRLRVEMEAAYREAGIDTIMLRGGDFIERAASGNWFDSQIAVNAHKGKVMYPGPLDRVHAWAYLPDFAYAAVLLAERRHLLSGFNEFGFEGFSLTGAQLVAAIADATGRAQRLSKLPWPMLRLLGVFSPLMREVVEMRYLWQVPHRIDQTKLLRMVPEFQPTALADAMADVLAPDTSKSSKAARSLSISVSEA